MIKNRNPLDIDESRLSPELKKLLMRQFAKLDKKYYNKGIEIFTLRQRTFSVINGVICLLNEVSAEDVSLALYMLVKDTNFDAFVHRYEYALELAKERPEAFCEQLYEFYIKMASEIKKNNYYEQFFEFLSFFQCADLEAMNEAQQYVYRAYMILCLTQLEFLRTNKLDINKVVAGLSTDGKIIEIDDLYANADVPLQRLHHSLENGPVITQMDILAALYKNYKAFGYKVLNFDDVSVIQAGNQIWSNTVSILLPYTNEFTMDILPQNRFNPVYTDYEKEIPTPLQNGERLKDALCHRKRVLPANGVKIHFENSTFTNDILLKEVFYSGAVICLWRLETKQGDLGGFYNTKTKQFAMEFSRATPEHLRLADYNEFTVLWAYAAYACDSSLALPNGQSYNDYMRDEDAEITFTAIGGKLRVPTECKHIRTIAGNDKYETDIKHINGYIRKLPSGQKASERAIALAEALGYDLAEDETYVQPFERTSWIVKKGEQ